MTIGEYFLTFIALLLVSIVFAFNIYCLIYRICFFNPNICCFTPKTCCCTFNT